MKEISLYYNPQFPTIEVANNQFLPDNLESFQWLINDNQGIGEFIIICAKYPFNKTIEQLTKNNGFKLQSEQVLNLQDTLGIAKSVLEDLQTQDSNNDAYSLDVKQWTTFKFVYEIT